MSDQSVRVARILGWEYSTVSEWGDMGWWRPDDPDAPPLAVDRPYDADDLREWLRHHLLDGVLEWESDGVRIYVHRGETVWLNPTGKEAEGPFPTLLAALEAAVLAVAEAWPQRWMTGIDAGDPQ